MKNQKPSAHLSDSNFFVSGLLLISLLLPCHLALASDKMASIFANRGFDPEQVVIPHCCDEFPYERLEKVSFKALATFDLFPEGPSYRPADDSWFFAGNNALSRVDRSGAVEVLMEKPGAGGTHFLPDGSILVIGKVGLRRVFPDGKVALLVDGEEIGPGNDITMGRYQEVYFTVPSKGIYRLTPGKEGRVERVIEEGANGLDVDPTGRYLFVARKSVERYMINGPDLPLGEAQTIYTFPEGKGGGDGCTFDAHGNFYTVHFKTGLIRVISPQERDLIGEIQTGVAPASNLTFGGPNNTQLLVTAGAPKFANCQVLLTDLGVTGFCGHAGATEYPVLRWLEEEVAFPQFVAGE
ncbi:MAG: SMP-30/gluconolactonase/LRE family protein [Verrucomicrobiota bacterium]